ncbi:MAG: hypothetical protein LBQ21_07510 [Clostridiales Family XIII bacterium]|jgi:hypothetical protein|nr:hypothetical protein [Clostridiales Family XIII bacterium]
MAKKRQEVGKPELPQGIRWPKATKDWFDCWRGSSRTDGWDDAQWHFLFDTALVHAAIWGAGRVSLTPELKRRLAIMGLAFEVSEKVDDVGVVRISPLSEARKMREKEKARLRRELRR